MSTPALDHCSVEYGGRPSRGYKITCGRCHKTEKVHQNTMSGRAFTNDDVELRKVQQKLENHGWLVAKRQPDNRCESCLEEQAKEKAMKVVQMAPREEQPHAPPPRTMSPIERRTIFYKVDESYLNEKDGYKLGWTDSRVAKDLSVPLAWVKDVRESSFGPSGSNAEIEVIMEEGRVWKADAKGMLDKIDAIAPGIMDLRERYERIERRLADVEKALK